MVYSTKKGKKCLEEWDSTVYIHHFIFEWRTKNKHIFTIQMVSLVLPPRDHHIRAGKIFCARTNTDYYFFVVGFPDADLVVLKKQI